MLKFQKCPYFGKNCNIFVQNLTLRHKFFVVRRIEIDIPFDNETLNFKDLAIKAIPIIERYIEVFRGYIDC